MRRTDVEKTKEILRLHDELGLSQREIAAATGCSLGTVSSTLSKAKAADITYPVEMTAKQLGSALYPPKDGTGEEKHSEPDLENIHREMQRKGVTLTLLWEEYKTAHPDGLMYTQFCQRYRDFRKQNDVYMRKQYKSGERLETDWAGLTLPYGEGQKAYFFVAALPPGSAFHTCPALALPGLALAAAVPTAWAAWALLAEPPDGLPPEQLLEQAPGFDFATLCDFERPAAVP